MPIKRISWPILLALLLAGCGQPDAATLAPPTVAAPPPAATAQPTSVPYGHAIADLLRARPAAGTTVETDAYFSGGGMLPSGPRPPLDQVSCPLSFFLLTDRPFRAFLQVLNETTGNLPPHDAAWLIAATPEMRQPGQVITPDLPYHARLRGHFGEPAFAQCANTDRIFVVEAVMTTYEQQPPSALVAPMQLPPDFATWPRYHDDALGYSLPYPPDWHVRRVDDATLELLDPRWPTYPVRVRVYGGRPPAEPSSGGDVFEQGYVFGETLTDTQHLAGSTVDREPAPGQRAVAVRLDGDGRTFELALTYPTGFDAPQPLLTAYSAIVAGFQLDQPPPPALSVPADFPSSAPTETAPVAQDTIVPPTFTPAPPANTSTEASLTLTPTPAPFPGDFQLTLVVTPSVGAAPLSVKLEATIEGEPDNSEVLYCPTQTWDFGDDQQQIAVPTCAPWSPHVRIPRRYAADYQYTRPGTYHARLHLDHGPFGIDSNTVTLVVR